MNLKLIRFNSLDELYTNFRTEDKCRQFFERAFWKGKPFCPHCGKHKPYRFTDRIRHKCRSCRKQFTIRTGTFLERSKVPLRKWLVAIYQIITSKKGIASTKLARDLNIRQKTAWLMLHKIRHAMKGLIIPLVIKGSAEVDESYIGGKGKGKRGRGSTSKTPVVGIVGRAFDENGLRPTLIFATNNVTRNTLHRLIHRRVLTKNILYTDEFLGYNGLERAYDLRRVTHSKGEYVRKDAHVNNAERTWGLFKRGFKGVYHNMSDKYLQAYCDEIAFRHTMIAKDDYTKILTVIEFMQRKITSKELKNQPAEIGELI